MKVGFIGVGNMGGAIIKGALSQKYIQPHDTYVYDINKELQNTITSQFGVNSTENAVELVQRCDSIILCVKPIFMEQLLDEISAYLSGKMVVSIAAGCSISTLSKWLNENETIQIVRVMPNTPALVGCGYTAICEESRCKSEEKQWVIGLFACLGEAEVLPERLIDAVITVAGSSPAYVYMFIEALADGAVKQGMPRKLALKAAAQAVMGSAKMVIETGIHPGELKDQVCSPGGTTIEAVETLEKEGFRGAVLSAMDACARRSKEMEKSI